MTNEEIKKILDEAPRNTNQYEDCGKYWYVVGGSDIYLESPMHHLADLRKILEQDATILELRQEVEQLQQRNAELEAQIELIDEVIYQHGKTVELSDSYQFQIDDDVLDKVLSLTPNQSLNALKRELLTELIQTMICGECTCDRYVEQYTNTNYPTEGE